MRSGNLNNRIKFYAKVSTRDIYNSSIDSWPVATITTRGEVRYVGGNKELNNDEKFYSKTIELTVRYRSDIVETMRVQINDKTDLYSISYMEVLGRNEGIRLSLEKLGESLTAVNIDPPSNFIVSLLEETDLLLTWTCNSDDDSVSIERSVDGVNYSQIAITASGVTTYTDTYLDELTRYFYRIRSYHQSNYSEYAIIDDAITDVYVLPVG